MWKVTTGAVVGCWYSVGHRREIWDGWRKRREDKRVVKVEMEKRRMEEKVKKAGPVGTEAV